ncbi:hypothetical protein EJF36_07585 [Bacillus sp. HMF5848]|uniref:CPBP family glutamic-type intramembrane protease n=1 Tax=Bacillus sp. HMF5848 TaxID=2495421 RepID=UPI000F777A8F|nr:CPBP family glutamic-type intramembrane protease [Bacillus sp. HMF5848]RSK26733.1 hypothetical protein EJF36_07585 [Bacillus sp. HMF5848]
MVKRLDLKLLFFCVILFCSSTYYLFYTSYSLQYYLLLPFVAWIIIQLIEPKEFLHEVKLTKLGRTGLKIWGKIIGLAITMNVINYTILWSFTSANLNVSLLTVQSVTLSFFELLLVGVVFLFTSIIWQEIVWRGWIYERLRGKSFVLAVISSSFGQTIFLAPFIYFTYELQHYGNVFILYVLFILFQVLLNIYLITLREESQSIWPSSIFQAIYYISWDIGSDFTIDANVSSEYVGGLYGITGILCLGFYIVLSSTIQKVIINKQQNASI